jgi:hypothetical protein
MNLKVKDITRSSLVLYKIYNLSFQRTFYHSQMKLMFACYILLVHLNAFYFYKHSYIFKLIKLLIRGIGQGRQQLFVEIIFFIFFGGTTYGCWIIALALPPLSPHYGVMARPVGAHPNGMSSKPQQTLAWGFSHVQGNSHYGNIKFRGR